MESIKGIFLRWLIKNIDFDAISNGRKYDLLSSIPSTEIRMIYQINYGCCEMDIPIFANTARMRQQQQQMQLLLELTQLIH